MTLPTSSNRLLSLRSSLSRRTALTGGLVGLLTLAGCGGNDNRRADSRGGNTPTTTVQNCDQDLAFDSAPNAVLSLYPSMTELMLALGVKDRLIGHANTNLSPPIEEFEQEFSSVKVLATGEPSIEALLAARPDLLIADGPYHFDGERLPSIQDLDSRGIPVYINQSFCAGKKLDGKVTDVQRDLTNLGQIFGVEERATELVDEAQSQLDDVANRLDGRNLVPAVILTVFEKTLYVDAGGLYTDVLTLAGGENQTPQSEMPPDEYFAEVSPETVAQKDPTAIVYTFLDEESRANSEQFLRERFAATKAVQENRLIATPEATFSGALRSVRSLPSLAKSLHPEAFQS